MIIIGFTTLSFSIQPHTPFMMLMNLVEVLKRSNRLNRMCPLHRTCPLYIQPHTPFMTLMNLGEILERNTLFLGARTLSTPLQTRFRFRSKINNSILGIVGV